MIKYSIKDYLDQRILILDGGLGTMVQSFKLKEQDYRGSLYADSEYKMLGCNDILVQTAPEVISSIHESYLRAGADIITTDTFNANAISMLDYGLQDKTYEINLCAVRLARKIADQYTLMNPSKPRFVAGSIGPTNRSLSISSDVNNPASREVTFTELVEAYYTQAKGMLDGDVDLFLIETVFDTLNAKAAIFAIQQLFKDENTQRPIMISGTLTDKSGRTLSGQTLEAFYQSIIHAKPLSVGLNCSFGAKELRSHIAKLSSIAGCYVSAHPNAGLPNLMGEYDQTAEIMGEEITHYLEQGLINIIGGCCGTTPEHIALIAKIAKNYAPRKVPTKQTVTTLSGLEPLYITPESNFVNVGERSNVAGSAKFARLIREQKFEEALSIVRHQVEAGAQIVDVCMDDGLINAKEAMTHFLNYMMSDPEISRVPVMVDSSSWEVLESGLQCVQGKSVVNSISLKEGEQEFIRKAKIIQNYGAAAVVMLFDQKGQADTFERKIEVAQRAYDLLTRNGFAPEDIIFDPNVLSVATGIEQHESYGLDFINACGWIKKNLPFAKVSGGVSNLSFSFRGNNTIREAMHSVFLFHAIKQGMDMGIVNPAMLQIYSELNPTLLRLCEDVILNRSKDATENLTKYANETKNSQVTDSSQKTTEKWRSQPVRERLAHALIKGDTEFIEQDTLEIYNELSSPIEVIDKVLMPIMGEIGDLFSDGQMFLPQVVKSARVMKASVGVLSPYIEAQNNGQASSNGHVLIATVKGDVHDIGKNIISVVMTCNGYKIEDLGVMIECEQIVNKAQELKVDAIGLSGLITPSLEEMCTVLRELQRRNLSIPVIVGGATTSELHTAVKMAPLYDGVVIQSKDASQNVMILSELMSDKSETYISSIKAKQALLRQDYNAQQQDLKLKPLDQARKCAYKKNTEDIVVPNQLGKTTFIDFSIKKVEPYINWTFFFSAWGIKGHYPEVLSSAEKGEEATKLYNDAQKWLQKIDQEHLLELRAVVGIHKAHSQDDDIVITQEDGSTIKIACLRNQTPEQETNLSLADFISWGQNGEQDYIASFAASAGFGLKELSAQLRAQNNDYEAIMCKLLADRLTEAFAEYLHQLVRETLWGFESEQTDIQQILHGKYQGIRAAFGYPSCPDHSLKREIFKLLDVEQLSSMHLNENFMIEPGEAVCGLIFADTEAKNFSLGAISQEQLKDYAQRRGFTIEQISKLTAKF